MMNKKQSLRRVFPVISVALILTMALTGCQPRASSQPPADPPALPSSPAPTTTHNPSQEPEKPAGDEIVLSDRYSIQKGLFAPNSGLSITYPIIKGMQDQQIEDQVNAFLKDVCIPKDMRDVTSDATFTHGYRQEFKVSLFSKNLLNLEVYGYILAAYPIPTKYHCHIDLTTGKVYELADLFRPASDYVQRLGAMVRDQIDQDAWPLISQSKELYQGINIKQFSLTADALELYFTPYEIAPHAGGVPTFTIPYDSIGDMIDTNGALWRSFNDGTTIPAPVLPDFQKIMNSYEVALVEAINQSKFELLEPLLFPYSSLYDAKRNLLADLFEQGAKERFESCEVVSAERIPGTKNYRLHVREQIAIQYPGEQFVSKRFEYAYTIKYMPGERGYLLSAIQRWTN